MHYFTQTKFPRLWLAFQYLIGGTADKHRLAIERYQGQKKILEIGCSVGIVSQVFKKLENIEFTGIDIDESALIYARKRFGSFKNFYFRNISLSDLAKTGDKFDYVLFAGILHHVNDATALTLLSEIQSVLTSNATVIIMEPEKIRDDYSVIFRLFYKLEQGEFRRKEDDLATLVSTAGFKIKHLSGVLSAPNALPFLKAGRITFIEAAL